MIALVRHPAVASAGRCYGRTDLPLADLADAAALAARLAPLGGAVWTSPAIRCRCVAAALGSYHVDERLQELDFGAWEGLSWDDIPRDALDAWAADPWCFAPPGGESGATLAARVEVFHRALLTGDHVVITHGGPLRVLGALVEGRAVDLLADTPAFGSVSLFERVGAPVPFATWRAACPPR